MDLRKLNEANELNEKTECAKQLIRRLAREDGSIDINGLRSVIPNIEEIAIARLNVFIDKFNNL